MVARTLETPNRLVGWQSPEDLLRAIVLDQLQSECGDDEQKKQVRLRELSKTEGISDSARGVLRGLLE